MTVVRVHWSGFERCEELCEGSELRAVFGLDANRQEVGSGGCKFGGRLLGLRLTWRVWSRVWGGGDGVHGVVFPVGRTPWENGFRCGGGVGYVMMEVEVEG